MAIAISSPNAPPSDEQLARINHLLLSQIVNRGFRVAKDVGSAEYLMRVRFTPDVINSPGGHLELIGIEKNQRTNSRGGDNAAVEAGAGTLAELRKVISEVERSNAHSN